MSSSVLTKRSAEEAKLDEPSNPTKRHKKNANYYDIFGADARVEIEIRREELNKKRNSFLSSRDFHTLLLWMLGETVSPKWIFIKHRPLIDKVIIIQMDNLSESQMIAIKERHRHRLVKDSASIKPFAYFSKFCYCPLQLDVPKFDKSKSKHPSFKKLTIVSIDKIKGLKSNKNLPYHHQKKIKSTKNHSMSDSVFGNKYKYAPELLLCSRHELVSNGYPNYSDSKQRFEDFFHLQQPTQNRNDFEAESDTSSNSNSTTTNSPERECDYEKMVGLDCEMVVTTKGMELARISVVNEEGKCIYDELVLPSNEITDYCTKYSGITAKMMSNVTKRLSDIHSDLSLFLNSDSIICGHGLENDFCAMRMCHFRVIDTAICYPHHSMHSRYKNKLRYLAQKYLSRNIQCSQDGHSSDEDALAALDLVKLKLQFGPDYGLPKLTKYASIFTVLHHFEKKSCLIGPHELFAPISAATPVCSIPTVNDKESVDKMLGAMKKDNVDLIWCYLREHAVECLYDHLVKIYEKAEDNTVIIAASGNKDFNQLNELKIKKANAIKEGNIKEAEEYAEKVRKENCNAKQYPFWIFVKHDDN